jgi:enoyl-CoA hydratase/carnithine racemase
MSMLGLADTSDRIARQDRLDVVNPDVFQELDDAFYALEASADLDAVMSALTP